jgi:hypothetical protein
MPGVKRYVTTNARTQDLGGRRNTRKVRQAIRGSIATSTQHQRSETIKENFKMQGFNLLVLRHPALALASSYVLRSWIGIAVVMTASLYCAAQSGGGSGGLASAVQRPGRAASLAYPDAVKTNSSVEARLDSVPLRKPTSLDSAGIYVWKDSEGVWNLGLISFEEVISISGEVRATKPVTVDALENSDGALRALSPTNVKLDLAPASNVHRVLRFTTDADWIEFDFKVNGVQDVSRVFIGSGKTTPARMPFRILEQAATGASPEVQKGEKGTQQSRSSSEVGSGVGNGGGPGQRRP